MSNVTEKTAIVDKKTGPLVEFSINGKRVEVRQGETVLKGAKKAGIYIPALCYHPDLEPFGGCRLCIVEIGGARGCPTACTTPALEGMEVQTDTQRLKELRRNILEMILTEHPHACLVCAERGKCGEAHECSRKAGIATGCNFCPKNGRCGIQTVMEHVELKEITLPLAYKGLSVQRDNPFFDRDYNLCILCGRCVRACQRGVIKFMQRGGLAEIATAPGRSHIEAGCVFCGACVDHCPTGSLIERKRRWEGKPETQAKTICPFCAVGCEITAGIKNGRVIETLTNAQGCLRGRFCATELYDSHKRITVPMIRKHGRLMPVSWDEAISEAAKALKKYSRSRSPLGAKDKGGAVALIYSANCSNEDMYVFWKFADTAIGASVAYSPISAQQEPFWRKSNEENASKRQGYVPENWKQTKFFYLIGEDLPDGVDDAEFVIVQDMFLPERAGKIAQVVLPSAGYFEFQGSTTDFEGRVKAFEKAVEPRGGSKPDWWISAQLASKLGAEGFDYASAKDINKEMETNITAGGGGERRGEADGRPGEGEILPLGPELWNFAYRSVRLASQIKGVEKICKVKGWNRP